MRSKTHEIEFRRALCVVGEGPGDGPALLLKVAKGSRFTVSIVPQHKGMREVADLYFPDGSVAREISFEYFCFVESPELADPTQ